MAAAEKIVGAQRDFSAGELDLSMKRADENPVMRSGARQLSNFRIMSSKALRNRPGRTALFLENGRVEKVLMSPGNLFYLVFNPLTFSIRIYNAAGTLVYLSGTFTPNWPSFGAITYAIIKQSIYIASPGIQPIVLSWDGVSQTSTWTLANWTETITPGGQKRTLFYRISPPNITMQPSAVTGSITIVFSAPVLVAGMVGTRMRFCGRQILITGVTNSQVGTANVLEQLPPAVQITTTNTAGSFSLGDEVLGSTSGAVGIITQAPSQQFLDFSTVVPPTGFFQVGDHITGAVSGAAGIVVAVQLYPSGLAIESLAVNLTSSTLFVANETINGPRGGNPVTTVFGGAMQIQLFQKPVGGVSLFTGGEIMAGPFGSATVSTETVIAPQPVAVWDDEVMNAFRGYPSSLFYDQNRLGMANFPSVPGGIAWSAIGLPNDFFIAALPDNAIFELAPGKSQVLFVQPGMEGSEFVFTDVAVYYIPITVTNPLVPGSVAFNMLSASGCMPNVQPRAAGESIVYIQAGGAQIGAVQAPGAYYRPYIVDHISEFHSHLLTASPIVSIAIPTGPQQFEELYIYLARADGTLVVGKYAMRNGLLDVGEDGKPRIGWLPWNGAGTVSWVASLGGDVIFSSVYNGTAGVVEVLDNTQYLDCALLVNALPAVMAPPGGKGPLWWMPNGTVFLMDQSTRAMGTYQIDANGFIVPQFTGGENLSSAALVAGQPWSATVEPYVPAAPPGEDKKQRMTRRRTPRMAVYVSNSSGYVFARLFSGKQTPTSPPLGTIMNIRRVPAWNLGDNSTLPPPLREEVQKWRPLGRDYDPRRCIIKDTPGPLTVHEIGFETTV
jgi:hypothetical protein